MPPWIPILAASLGALLCLLLVVLLRALVQLQNSLKKVESRLASLDRRLKDQDAQISELRQMMTEPGPDPVMGMVQTALGWQKSGWMAAAASIGTQLFRSYWRSKSQKSLPLRKYKE